MISYGFAAVLLLPLLSFAIRGQQVIHFSTDHPSPEVSDSDRVKIIGLSAGPPPSPKFSDSDHGEYEILRTASQPPLKVSDDFDHGENETLYEYSPPSPQVSDSDHGEYEPLGTAPRPPPKISDDFDHGNGKSGKEIGGKRWAVLIAGSQGFTNYRHQADVCHAYQVLRNGGLKDENIVVFMYDDIAFNTENPSPGVIINKPYGNDVYQRVSKDYTGDQVNVNNFFAVLLGNKTGTTGGSGKVVDSGPNDNIFIYYTDHGGAGLLGMPVGDPIVAKDLMHVLKKKYAAKSYQNMVIYIEACEAGSMFEGLLPNNLNIYAITASNAVEASYGTYCGDSYPYSSPEYDGVCLGDLFSIAWLEDSDLHDLRKETLEQQYEVVRRRTFADNLEYNSHVMQYGKLTLGKEFLFSFLGTNPANDNFTLSTESFGSHSTSSRHVNQWDAGLHYLWHKFDKAPNGSHEKIEPQKKLQGELSHRRLIDESVNRIVKVLFGEQRAVEILKYVPPRGQPLVDDWNCFKDLVNAFVKSYRYSWTKYEMKHNRVFANICNAGTNTEVATAVIAQVRAAIA